MQQKYITPNFDFSAFETEDILTISIGAGPVEGGDDGWLDI